MAKKMMHLALVGILSFGLAACSGMSEDEGELQNGDPATGGQDEGVNPMGEEDTTEELENDVEDNKEEMEDVQEQEEQVEE